MLLVGLLGLRGLALLEPRITLSSLGHGWGAGHEDGCNVWPGYSVQADVLVHLRSGHFHNPGELH